jgi:hypothetical protein
MKLALCVGINQYRFSPDSTLRGCINDASKMRLFFHNEIGAETPVVLTDFQAEEQRIKDTLLDMREKALQGDVEAILYSHSSHGSNVPDRDGDEVDGLDEILCATDIRDNGETWSQGFIDDDWLYKFAYSLPGDTRLECFFDSCHSQTMLREMGLTYGRAKILLPPNPDFRKAPSKLLGNPQGRLPESVLWSGCDADSTSADAYIDGRFQGAFTAALLYSIKGKDGELRTRSDTIYFARQWLRVNNYAQFPHLECLKGLAFKRIGE